jgi:hypothetical protein
LPTIPHMYVFFSKSLRSPKDKSNVGQMWKEKRFRDFAR